MESDLTNSICFRFGNIVSTVNLDCKLDLKAKIVWGLVVRCDVTVWNRTKSKCDSLIGLGAKYKSSPEEVTAACDVTFAMLADPESAINAEDVLQQIDVACGKNGAASGISSGKGYPIFHVVFKLCLIVSTECSSNVSRYMHCVMYVDVSTVDVASSILISKCIKDAGSSFLEAPVSGSKKPVEDGLFLTAGDKPLYEKVAPFLDIMGKFVMIFNLYVDNS
ncbi:unnamed protein product [Arabis nemorensis]|uniref:6-phosphogluconate dehydrogenase NADP-binding domain-containing protein n=1 Tax=Arabis nemorensis TaxID=586526 RepID=A0A565CRR2_9BRAS|nr:unnamed protein product [Arabis nemorensis]